MTRRTLAAALLAFALATGVAQASWYDDYDAGLAAARAGNWSVVAQRMSAAIKVSPNENNKARTYGMDFRNYHPYYYRGAAYLNLGKYEQAIADLEKTSGPGPENIGTVESMLDRAKKQLASAGTPEPEPVRPPVTTPVNPTPAPVTPQIDPALRQRAAGALNATKGKLQAAQQRRAGGSPQYAQAMQMYSDAVTRNASARNNDDLNAVIGAADSAGDLADLAMPPNVPAPTPVTPAPITPSPTSITPKPTAAATAVMADTTNEVRRALENYFAGEFEDASRKFAELTKKMPTNGWIWAFLGASQYSQYAFEADENYRIAALRSFQKAKRLRSWSGGLPSKYFSKRIQKAFRTSS
jgi:tetratricopeptide (TPR) repeat protein